MNGFRLKEDYSGIDTDIYITAIFSILDILHLKKNSLT